MAENKRGEIMREEMRIALNVDMKYHRDQFDDWLGGGDVYYKGRQYCWCAQNSNYGFGWEVEPITEEDWDDMSDDEISEIIDLIKDCLYKHGKEYVF